MAEQDDIYTWLHKIQAPKVSKMSLGELLIYYITRRNSGADKANTGPANFINIITNDRLESLGMTRSDLDTMSEEEIRKLNFKP